MVLESLVSAIVVHAKNIELSDIVSEKLSDYYNILIKHSPIDLPMDQQYSMQALFVEMQANYGL